MKRAILFVALLISFLLMTTVSDAVAQRPGPIRLPDVPDRDAVDLSYWGSVTELTKDSITIQFPVASEKPKKFALSDTLKNGKIPMEPRPLESSKGKYRVLPYQMYRVTDVKVGDVVGISFAHFGELDICDHINIHKRPGGYVPPLPEEAEALLRPAPTPPRPSGKPSRPYIPYHEMTNARWDLEDKGIPYPEKFGENRRFPIAPMPREAIIRPAIAP